MAMAIELYNRSYSILIYMAEESVSFWLSTFFLISILVINLSTYKFTYFILYDLESVCRFFIYFYIF
jgi:hypothetical protein